MQFGNVNQKSHKKSINLGYDQIEINFAEFANVIEYM